MKFKEGDIVRVRRNRETRDQRVAGMIGSVAKDYGDTVAVNVRGRKEPVIVSKKAVKEEG